MLFIVRISYCSYQIKRGVLLRGETVAWTNGIVPYEIASGYGRDLLRYPRARATVQSRYVQFKKSNEV